MHVFEKEVYILLLLLCVCALVSLCLWVCFGVGMDECVYYVYVLVPRREKMGP